MYTKTKKVLSLITVFFMALSMLTVSVSAETDIETLTKVIYASAELGTNNKDTLYYGNDYNTQARFFKFYLGSSAAGVSLAESAVFKFQMHSAAYQTDKDKTKLALYDISGFNWSAKSTADELAAAGLMPLNEQALANKINAAGAEGTTAPSEVVSIDVKNKLAAADSDIASYMLYCGGEGFWTLVTQEDFTTAPKLEITYNAENLLNNINGAGGATIPAIAFPLDLNIEKYNKLSANGKAIVKEALTNKNFASLEEVKTAYNNAFSSLTYRDSQNKLKTIHGGFIENIDADNYDFKPSAKPTESAYVWEFDISSLKDKKDFISSVDVHFYKQTANAPDDINILFADVNIDTHNELTAIANNKEEISKYVDFAEKTYNFNSTMWKDHTVQDVTADITSMITDDLEAGKDISFLSIFRDRNNMTDDQNCRLYSYSQSPNDTYLTVTYDKTAIISKIKDMETTAEIEAYLLTWKDALGISDKTDKFSYMAVCLHKNADIDSVAKFDAIAENPEEKAKEIILSKVNGITDSDGFISWINAYGSAVGIDSKAFNALTDASKVIVANAIIANKPYNTAEALEKVLTENVELILGSKKVVTTKNILRNGSGQFALKESELTSWGVGDVSNSYMAFPIDSSLKADPKYIVSALATVNFVNASHCNGNWNVKYYGIPSNAVWNEADYASYGAEKAAELDAGTDIIGEASKDYTYNTTGKASITADITDYVKTAVASNDAYVNLRADFAKDVIEYRRVYSRHSEVRYAPYITVKYDMNGLTADLNAIENADALYLFIMQNGNALGLDTEKYNKLESKTAVNNALLKKNFKNANEIKTAFSNAMSKSKATVDAKAQYALGSNNLFWVHSDKDSNTYCDVTVTAPEYDSSYVLGLDVIFKRAGTGSGNGSVTAAIYEKSDSAYAYLGQKYLEKVDYSYAFDITDKLMSGGTITLGLQNAGSGVNVMAFPENGIYLRVSYDLVKIINDAAKAENPEILLTKYADALGIANSDISAVAAEIKGKTYTNAVSVSNMLKTVSKGLSIIADNLTNEGLTGTVDIENVTGEDKDVIVLVACYDENNRMIDCAYAVNEDGKILADSTETLSYTLSTTEKATVFRSFVWNAVSSMKPMAYHTEYTVQ